MARESAYTVRPGRSADLPFLRAMLFEAAFWRPEPRPPLETGLATPELAKLLAGWGERAGDVAVVAEAETTPIGAAWYRCWTDANHSYGYLDPDTPEIAIGVDVSWRRKGVGRALMIALMTEAWARGVTQLSLSVERDNPALGLYRSLGFGVVGTEGNAYTMSARPV